MSAADDVANVRESLRKAWDLLDVAYGQTAELGDPHENSMDIYIRAAKDRIDGALNYLDVEMEAIIEEDDDLS